MNWKKKIAEYDGRVRVATRIFRSANNVAQTLFYSRDGTMIEKGIAVVGVIGEVLGHFKTDRSPASQLEDMGYVRPLVSGSISEFFCERLRSSDLARREIETDEYGEILKILLWSLHGEDEVTAVYSRDHYDSGPYVKDGYVEHLTRALGEVVWKDASSLMLVVDANSDSDLAPPQRRGRTPSFSSNHYRLLPLGEPGAYMGSPSEDWLVSRLENGKSGCRTALLYGPAGVGKSTLARRIARRVAGDNGKTLTISSAVLSRVLISDIMDIVKYLRPDVLILDDFSQVEGHASNDALALLEMLHSVSRLVMLTWMTPSDDVKPKSLGAIGMRPGRIDEVVRLRVPSKDETKVILLHYFDEAGLKVSESAFNRIVKVCSGLSGAYLKEVAHRLSTHGVDGWEVEVKNLMEQYNLSVDGLAESE